MSDSEEVEDPLLVAARLAKQTYLKAEVLDKGYDAELFSDYVVSVRGDDLNIDDFNLEELQQMVSEFQTLPDDQTRSSSEMDEEGLNQIDEEEEKDGSSESNSDNEPKTPEKVALPTIDEELPQTSSDPVTSEPIPEDQPTSSVASPPSAASEAPRRASENVGTSMSGLSVPKQMSHDQRPSFRADHIKGLAIPKEESKDESDQVENPFVKPMYFRDGIKSEPTELTESCLVSLSEGQVKKGGLFSKQYVSFTLTTDLTNWVVERRFEDFEWLRNALHASHPDYMVPLIPKEVNQGSLTQEQPKRKLYLERFINAIVATPIFCRNSLVVDFLKESNASHFTKLRKQKLPAAPTIDSIKTLDGKIPVNSEVPSLEFMNKLNEFFYQSYQLQLQLKRLCGSLANNIKTVAQQYTEVADLVRQLMYAYALIPGTQKQLEVYGKFAEIFEQLASYQNHNVQEINEYLTTLFKFFYKQNPPLLDLFKARETKLQPWIKAEQKLKVDKEKLWLTQNYKKWGTEATDMMKKNKEVAMSAMLPKETTKTQDLKDLYGYFNYQAFNELARQLENSAKYQRTHFSKYAQAEFESFLTLSRLWKEFFDVLADSDESE